MSNLLKSKILLGVMIVAVVFVGAFAFTHTASASGCLTTSVSLKQGVSGAQVTCLQQALNVTPATGYFGTLTKAAVKTFQTANSLKADGVWGHLSDAALTANPVAGTFSAGCTSATGFSTTTGLACTASTSTVAGCAAGALFSSTTGLSCTSTLPAGCVAGALFSSTTGASCGTTSLTGGAGDLSITSTTADIETNSPEGATVHVLGFKTEATGSDIAVNNVKVTLVNSTTNAGTSTRLDHYAGKVAVMMGSIQVGSVDVSTFTKDGTTYSANIPLSGAIVRIGAANKQTFYVDVTALTNIDSADATGTGAAVSDNYWTATASQIRFTDGTGLTLTDTTSPAHSFSFYKIVGSGNLKLSIASTTSNPGAGNVKVSDTGSTANILLNEFTIKPQGADMTLTTLTLQTKTTGTGTAAEMLQSLILKANGSQVAEIDSVLGGANAQVHTNVFTLDNDLVMTAGSTVTFDVYAKANKIGTTSFAQGDSFEADYYNSTIETTVGGSPITPSIISGSAAGSILAFYSEGLAATVTQAITTIHDDGDPGFASTAQFTMKVTLSSLGSKDVYV